MKNISRTFKVLAFLITICITQSLTISSYTQAYGQNPGNKVIDTTQTGGNNPEKWTKIVIKNANFNVLTKRRETLYIVDLSKTDLSKTKKYSMIPKKSVLHIEKTLTQGTRTFYQSNGLFLKIKFLSKTKRKEFVKMNVHFVSQKGSGYPFGCEIVTAYQNMKYIGMKVNLDKLVQRMPKVSENGDPRKGFQGTPTRIVSNYNTIWPKALAPYLKKIDNHIVNISGSNKARIIKYLMKGMPVELYSTHGPGAKPVVYNKHYWGSKKVENLHVFSVAGYSKKTNRFYIVDPIFKNFWMNADKILKGYWPTRFALAFRK